jgi:hypothetical protein
MPKLAARLRHVALQTWWEWFTKRAHEVAAKGQFQLAIATPEDFDLPDYVLDRLRESGFEVAQIWNLKKDKGKLTFIRW